MPRAYQVGSTRRSARSALIAATAIVAALIVPALSAQAAPPAGAAQSQAIQRPASHARAGQPDLGPNVYVFSPDMAQSYIQHTVDAIAALQLPNQFGPQRYSLLFLPGTYGSVTNPLSFQVGYYTEVAGLGASPTDVTVNGTINVYNQCSTNPDGTPACIALNNFWRSLSNLTINVTGQTDCRSGTDFWAVSQAAPMRRVNVTGGNVSLMDYCGAGPYFASGGFIADSAFAGGTVINGSQQQFVVRNSNLDGWTNGVWNQVFAGVNGAPAQSFSPTSGLPEGTNPYTTLAASPVTREKPYLYTDASSRFRVFVPAPQRNSVGATWVQQATPGTSISIRKFFLAKPGMPVSEINAALRRGRNLIFTPGVYELRAPVVVTRPDTVVLGMGFATLVPQRGTAAMVVTASRGAAVSGLLIDAGPKNSRVLLRTVAGRSKRSDPTLIQDVFFRIGGARAGKASTSLVVGGSNTILDDIWAWRADHGTGVGWRLNTAATGLVVSGNDVTAYGLFVEHYQRREVVWTGQRGTVIFFQNEMPYDPPSQSAWRANRWTKGYPAFTVGPRVTSFQGYGMGSYSFFNQGVDIHASTAFAVPAAPAVQLHDVLTRYLNGSGGIDHVVNATGAPVNAAQPGPADVVSYP